MTLPIAAPMRTPVQSTLASEHPTPPGARRFRLWFGPHRTRTLLLLDRLGSFWRLCGGFYDRDPLEGGGQEPPCLGVALALGLQLISEIVHLAAQGLE